MANYYNTTCVVQGPRKALLEVQQVFNGFKRDERIFANHPAIMNDKFLWMKFDAKKGLIIKTVSRDVTHESAVVDYMQYQRRCRSCVHDGRIKYRDLV